MRLKISSESIPRIVINEVCALAGRTIKDGVNDGSDYIELYNCSEEEISLAGWHLSDDQSRPQLYTLPEYTIGPREHLVLYANGTEGEYCVPFKISDAGEKLFLSEPDGKLEDSVVIPELDLDTTYSRVTDGDKTWAVRTPTVGSTNSQAEAVLDVALEDLGKQQFQIKANTIGTVAGGCALGNVYIDNTNVVQVSGPMSVVSRIDSVIANINVEGMSTDITDNVIPVFYDINGEVIDTTKLYMSVNYVRITAEILNTKDVPLVLSTTGTPKEGYQLVDVSCAPKMVRIKGVPAVLNTLDEIKIPAEVLDISGATATIEKTIDISTYLEEGVSLVISSDAKVNVKAEIEPVEMKEYKVSVSNLSAEKLKSGYLLSYPDQFVYVSVIAGKRAHADLKPAAMKGIIDVSNLNEGEHMVEIKFDLDESVYHVDSAFVTIQIEKEEREPEPEGSESIESTESTEEKPGMAHAN